MIPGQLHKRETALFAITLFLSCFCQAQIIIQNSSFESNVKGPGMAPPGWTVCYGTPDIQPGSFCINTTPSDGSTYIGFVFGGGGSESIGQQLTVPLQAGVRYTFTIDLAAVTPLPGNIYCGGSSANRNYFQLWAGNSPCAATELLWQSDTVEINDTSWTTHQAVFVPNNSYTYISLKIGITYFILSGMLIDNMSPSISEVPWRVWFTLPSENSNQSCSFIARGKLDNIPQTLNLHSSLLNADISPAYFSADSSFEALINYPDNLKGIDTLIVEATFSTGSYTSSDTLIVNVAGYASFSAQSFCRDFLFTYAKPALNDPVASAQLYAGDGSAVSWTGSDTSFYYSYLTDTDTASLVISTISGCKDSSSQIIQAQNCPQIAFTFPTYGSSQSCSFLVKGKSGSVPQILSLYSYLLGTSQAPVFFSEDSTFEIELNYPTDIKGTDTLILSATFSGAYISTDTLILTVNSCPEDIFITNLITPNGDGKNDVFEVIRGKSILHSQLEIYNRWGEKIYEKEDYRNDWGGETEKDGIYFYYLKIAERVYKGWLEIRR